MILKSYLHIKTRHMIKILPTTTCFSLSRPSSGSFFCLILKYENKIYGMQTQKLSNNNNNNNNNNVTQLLHSPQLITFIHISLPFPLLFLPASGWLTELSYSCRCLSHYWRSKCWYTSSETSYFMTWKKKKQDFGVPNRFLL